MVTDTDLGIIGRHRTGSCTGFFRILSEILPFFQFSGLSGLILQDPVLMNF